MGILKGPRSIVPPCANGVRDHQWMRQRSFTCHVFEEPTLFTLGSPLGTHQCRYGPDRTLLAPERVSIFIALTVSAFSSSPVSCSL